MLFFFSLNYFLNLEKKNLIDLDLIFSFKIKVIIEIFFPNGIVVIEIVKLLLLFLFYIYFIYH